MRLITFYARNGRLDTPCSGSQRRRVCGEHPHGLDRELLDGSLHERAAAAGPGAVLEIIELSHDIARRAPRDTGYGPEPFQVGAVARCALKRLACAAGRSERLAF